MKTTQYLESILALTLGALIVYWITKSPVAIYIAIILLLVGLLLPGLARIIHTGWMKLGHLLGRISSSILLTIVYFIILMPLALVRRLMGANGMRTKAGKQSYYVERNHTYTADDLADMW